MTETAAWERVRLGDVADVSWGDTSTTKSAYVEDGYAAYSASGRDGFLPRADYSKTGVVISAIGAQAGKTWLAKGHWSCIKNTLRMFSTSPSVSTEYLYWATRAEQFWPLRGSAQPFISQSDAREVSLRIPPIGTQRAIAEVLGALDDKIEANNRLRSLADRVWLAHVDDALRRSTETTSLAALASFVNGRAFTKGATGTGRMVVRIAELNSGPGGSTVYNDIDVSEQYLTRPGDLLFA